MCEFRVDAFSVRHKTVSSEHILALASVLRIVQRWIPVRHIQNNKTFPSDLRGAARPYVDIHNIHKTLLGALTISSIQLLYVNGAHIMHLGCKNAIHCWRHIIFRGPPNKRRTHTMHTVQVRVRHQTSSLLARATETMDWKTTATKPVQPTYVRIHMHECILVFCIDNTHNMRSESGHRWSFI